MSKSCSVCWAWQPKQYNGWKYIDEKANCIIHNTFTNRDYICGECSIIKPKHFVARVKGVEDELEDWYKDQVTKTVASEDKELFKHQKEDVDRFSGETEIALFNEMGTGKSATALRIASNKYLAGEIDALLIVAPNDVHAQWAKEEVPKWMLKNIEYQCQCLYGRGGKKEAMPFYDDGSLQIVCVNIDTFSTPSKWEDIAEWANSRKTFIILDEATCIKNIKSKRTERMLYAFNSVKRCGRRIVSNSINSAARAILTGTPTTKGPMDLWSMMEFLRPNFFGRNWYAFQNRYAMHSTITVNNRKIPILLNSEIWEAVKGINDYNEAYNLFGVSVDTFNTIHSQDEYSGPYKHAEELRDAIKSVASFRLLKDCTSMPPQNYVKRSVEMSPDIKRCYIDMRDGFLAEYENKVATAKNKVGVYIRLQQISSGFMPVLPDELDEDGEIPPHEVQWIGSTNPKLEALYNDIDELAKPIIVITHFNAEADRIYNDLKNKYRCCLMTGWKKVGTIEEFKEGKYDICIANIKVKALICR